MSNIFIAILIGAIVLVGVAKLVNAAGPDHILTINYATIDDPEKVNRWAASCLFRAAWAAGMFALAAFAMPTYSKVILGLFFTLVVGTAIAILLGARKFRRA